MVLIHVSKGNDTEHQFLYETKADALVEEVTNDIANIHNLRLRVQRLAGSVRLLAKYGPMKPETERGLSAEEIESGSDEKLDPNADPTGTRVGIPPAEDVAKVLLRTAAEAEAAASTKHIAANKPIDVQAIHEAVQNVKGAVMIAYPMGLPEYDVTRLILEDKEDLKGQSASKDVLEADSAVLWFAGKQMMRDHPVSKYTGKNDKVKIKAKLASKTQGAPQRESGVDEETRRNMIAMYHKKNQEAQQLEQDDEDSYLNSEWANPKAFKHAVTGVGPLRFKPF